MLVLGLQHSGDLIFLRQSFDMPFDVIRYPMDCRVNALPVKRAPFLSKVRHQEIIILVLQ